MRLMPVGNLLQSGLPSPVVAAFPRRRPRPTSAQPPLPPRSRQKSRDIPSLSPSATPKPRLPHPTPLRIPSSEKATDTEQISRPTVITKSRNTARISHEAPSITRPSCALAGRYESVAANSTMPSLLRGCSGARLSSAAAALRPTPSHHFAPRQSPATQSGNASAARSARPKTAIFFPGLSTS